MARKFDGKCDIVECESRSPRNCENCANSLLRQAGFRLDGTVCGEKREKQLRATSSLMDPVALKQTWLSV